MFAVAIQATTKKMNERVVDIFKCNMRINEVE